MYVLSSISHERLLYGVLHDVSPVVVDNLKHLPLLGHLLHDILRREDRIKVEPLSLNLQPLIDRLLDPNHALFPLTNLFLERFDERRPSHRLDPDDLVLEQHQDVVDGRQDRYSAVAILSHREVHCLPVFHHLLLRLLQRVLLSAQNIKQKALKRSHICKTIAIEVFYKIFSGIAVVLHMCGPCNTALQKVLCKTSATPHYVIFHMHIKIQLFGLLHLETAGVWKYFITDVVNL